MDNYKKNAYWYLGFLGFIGFYKLPKILLVFQGEIAAWELTNVLWFLWLFYFIPTKQT